MTAYIDNIKIEGTADEIIQFLEVYKANMSGDNSITVQGGWTIQDDSYIICQTCHSAPCRCTARISSNEKINWKFP